MKQGLFLRALLILLVCSRPSTAQTLVTFDDVAGGTVVNNQYAALGVTFGCLPGKPKNICSNKAYAVANRENRSGPNVIGLANAFTGAVFDEQYGYLVARFRNPVAIVSIDATCFIAAESGGVPAENYPFLQAFGPIDPLTGKNPLIGAVRFSYSLPVRAAGNYAPWTTMTLSRAANDIAMVVFSSTHVPGSNSIYGVFDNLRYNTVRPLSIAFAGLGKGTLTSSPAGLSASVAATANFPSGSTVVLTASPHAPETTTQVVKLPNGVLSKMPMRVSYSFAGWSGDASSCPATQNTCSITMDKAKNVTVTFNRSLAPLATAK